MCTIVTGLAMLVFGIIALVRGRFTLTRTKVVSGVPARIIGVILLMPLPLMLASGLLLGVIYGIQGKQPRAEDLQGIGAVLELGIIFLCFLAAVIVGVATARPPTRRRVPDELDDDYDRRFQEDDYPQPDRRDRGALRPPDDGIRE
jgi:hypothetical protein